MPRKLTQDEFIYRASLAHGRKYDYSKSIYKNKNTKIIIICPTHGEFEQYPIGHLNGNGCANCYYEQQKINQRCTIDEFIKKSINIHGNKYDYSKVEYINSYTKVSLICPIHGEFKQEPQGHLNSKNGCPECGNKEYHQNRVLTQNQFIKKAKDVHGKKYDYSLTKYTDSRLFIDIICKKHGIFVQRAHSHIQGNGCPSCNESKGEIRIKQYLDSKNIAYKIEEWFKDSETPCKNPKTNHILPFDFYLPDQEICIEFDGVQHYKSVKWFGGEKAFTQQKERDNIKTEYCKNNKIKFLRIPYNKLKNIDVILENFLR